MRQNRSQRKLLAPGSSFRRSEVASVEALFDSHGTRDEIYAAPAQRQDFADAKTGEGCQMVFSLGGKGRLSTSSPCSSQNQGLLDSTVDSLGSFSALIARTPVRESKHPVRDRPARETVSLDGSFLVRFRHFAFVERECVVPAAAFTLENVCRQFFPSLCFSSSAVSCP